MANYPGWITRYAQVPQFFPRFFKYVNTPMEDYFESRLTDPELKRILGMISYRGTPASFGLSFMSYFLDYYYSEGGVQAIPRRPGRFHRGAGRPHRVPGTGGRDTARG